MKKSLKELTLDDFRHISGRNEDEITNFNVCKQTITESKDSLFWMVRDQGPLPKIKIHNSSGKESNLLNFSTYNYLGYATHPKVIKAATEAIKLYGLGCSAAPSAGGTLAIHNELKKRLLNFFDSDGHGISFFNSGFSALVGTISAYINKNDCVIADNTSHASIIDGMVMSQAETFFFRHNNMADLEAILNDVDDGERRILICTEGLFSVDGDFGDIRSVVTLAKQHGAKVLVDEAHSFLTCGPSGKGAAEAVGAYKEVDMIVGTMSKTLAGIGGFLLAKEELANFVDFFARNRMFSCALDPAVTGGMIAALELATGNDGKKKREKLHNNAKYMRSLLEHKVKIIDSDSWIIPVLFGSDSIAFELDNFLQKSGLAAPLMVFPAVRKSKGRIRLFVTSEHSKEHIEQAAKIIIKAAKRFGFNKIK